MTIGQIVTIPYGPHRNKRGEVIRIDGRFVIVKGAFGTLSLLASEVSP